MAERTADLLQRLFDPAALVVTLAAADDPARLRSGRRPRGSAALARATRSSRAVHGARRVVRSEDPARLGAPLEAAGHTMGSLAVWGKRPGAFTRRRRAGARRRRGAGRPRAAEHAAPLAPLRGQARVGGDGGRHRPRHLHRGRSRPRATGEPLLRRAGRTRRSRRCPGAPGPTLLPRPWAEPIRAAIGTPGAAGATEIRHERRIYSASALALKGDDDRSAVLIIEDHTETRRLQEHLIQSEKLTGHRPGSSPASRTSSTTRSPRCWGSRDYLVESGDVPPHLAEPLRVIQQEAQRAATIVKTRAFALLRSKPLQCMGN